MYLFRYSGFPHPNPTPYYFVYSLYDTIGTIFFVTSSVNMPLCANTGPVPGLYWADAASIGSVSAQFGHITACVKG